MRAAPLSGAEKLHGKSVFTTFEAAKICDVTPVTIQNWIDKGWLEAYRTPGGHRRVSREALLSFLEALLRDRPGCDVRVARDGFRAGVLYAGMKPDVVILDLNHPGVDGYEACRQIRRGEAGGDALILAIGGPSDGRGRIPALGAAHCLPKPVDAGALRRLVWEFLSNRRRAAPRAPGGFSASESGSGRARGG